MKRPWNKRDAMLAVAAREARRIERASNPPVESRRYVPRPRPAKPDFIVRIESARGERMQISINRFMGLVRTSDGQSVRQFCRGLEHLFTKSA